MTQQRRITPSGWLAIALAAYIVLFGLAYEYVRRRPSTIQATVSTSATNADLVSDVRAESSTPSLPLVGTLDTVETPIISSEVVTPEIDFSNYRAAIMSPTNGALLQDADGWVELQGRLNSRTAENERYFLVLESPASNPPIVYPQQEITASATGDWTAQVRFASPGQSYRTYVIATTDVTAVNALFSHEALAGLPNGFEIISNVNVNAIQ